MIDGVVQEVDIATGKVLFQWNSADHVPYSFSEQPLPASAEHPLGLVSRQRRASRARLFGPDRRPRHVGDVRRQPVATARIKWQLGGKDSSFTPQAGPGQSLDQAGEIFAWQHDPNYLGDGVFTFFDNESSGTALFPTSRTVTFRVNPATRTATLISSNDQPEGLVAPSQGNAQTTAEGNQFVGWGALRYISEFSPTGSLLFNAEFPTGVNSYRAYLLPWSAGTPTGQ